MNPNSPPNLPTWAYLIPLVVIGLVILRNARARQLKVERMWIGPAVILGLTGMLLVQQPPSAGLGVALDLAALLLGGFLGWHRGRFTRITVDPATHAVTSQSSPMGMLLILAIFALRSGVRAYAMQNASALHMSLNDLTDAFMLLAVGLVCATRLEMALRASRLVREARGGGA